MHSHWKTIVHVANTDELQLGNVTSAILSKYNGKPFLCNKSHTMKRHGDDMIVLDHHQETVLQPLDLDEAELAQLEAFLLSLSSPEISPELRQPPEGLESALKNSSEQP